MNLKSRWYGAKKFHSYAQSNECCHAAVRYCWRELDYNLILTVMHLHRTYTVRQHLTDTI